MERLMYKLFLMFTAILFLGDPTLSFLAEYGEVREAVMVAIMALVATPWVVSQLDN
jgi:hypothetical protein